MSDARGRRLRERSVVLLAILAILGSMLAYAAARPPAALAFGPAFKLAITVDVAPLYTADDDITLTVEVQDEGGARVENSTATVNLTSTSASLSGTTSMPADAGVAAFTSVNVRTVGTGYGLDANSGELAGASSSSFNVTHGAATKLVVTDDVSSTYAADDAIGLTVEIQDAWDNTVTTGLDSTATVGLTLTNPGTATLTGTASKPAVAGVAAFTVHVRKVGTGYGLAAASGPLTGDSSSAFDITPGALDYFAVVTSPATKVAGVAFNMTATAYDHWDNAKTDYVGPADVSGDLSTSQGVNTAPGDNDPPDYVDYSNAAWPSGVRTAQVTAYVAESGRTVTVSVADELTTFDGTASGTSGLFTVDPAAAASVAFSVDPNDTAFPFNFGPISTKAGTPIYSACAPPNGPQTNPCALTTGTPNASTSVRALVRDEFGNRIAPRTVTVTATTVGLPTPVTTTLGSDETANGVADFGENLSIPTVRDYTLTAKVTSGPTSPETTPAKIAIVNDLEACKVTTCDNNASNGLPSLLKAFGKITAGTGVFFDTNTNVLLSTQFVPESQVNGRCGNNVTIGTQATDMMIRGVGVTGTAPSTTMILIIPKDTLKKEGITSRGTPSFNVCLGALYIGTGTPSIGWKQKATNNGPPTPILTPGAEGRYWGIPADCGTAGLSATDPCIGLRTKQVAAVRAYPGITAADITAMGIKDADMVIIIKKPFPWDGKGGAH